MTPKTVTRSLSLYPDDWEKLDHLAAVLTEKVNYPVKAPGVVRNLLQYGEQLVRESEVIGLKRP